MTLWAMNGKGRVLARGTWAAVAVVAVLMVAGGCRYSTTRPFDHDIQTVHVETFTSQEFRRDLEFQLSEALVKRIEQDTPYRIASRDEADVLISGEILRVQNRAFGNDLDTDWPREIGSSVVVRYRVQDLRTGKILVEHPRFLHQASYVPSIGETFDEGMLRALDGLAERIVESMEEPW